MKNLSNMPSWYKRIIFGCTIILVLFLIISGCKKGPKEEEIAAQKAMQMWVEETCQKFIKIHRIVSKRWAENKD